MVKYEFKEGTFIPIEVFRKIKMDNVTHFHFGFLNLEIISVNNGDVIVWGKNIYILKEKIKIKGNLYENKKIEGYDPEDNYLNNYDYDDSSND